MRKQQKRHLFPEEAKSKKDRELQEPKMSSEAELRNIVKPLVNWYRENKRDLPWRHNPDAYRVWVSEIMLQQTRVEAVKGYYDRFLKALPTVKDLAEAEEDVNTGRIAPIKDTFNDLRKVLKGSGI